jgi:hypothetical protein
MNVARKQVSHAIFALLQSVYQFRKTELDLRGLGHVDAEEQPYLGLVRPRTSATQQKAFGLTIWELQYVGVVYMRKDATQLAPGVYWQDFLDDIEDTIDKAFQPATVGTPNTLNGLVTNCWIEGDIEIDPGILDQQIAMFIPIKVLTGI